MLFVGVSSLAMVVNDNAGDLAPIGALESIASMLAPTDAKLFPIVLTRH